MIKRWWSVHIQKVGVEQRFPPLVHATPESGTLWVTHLSCRFLSTAYEAWRRTIYIELEETDYKGEHSCLTAIRVSYNKILWISMCYHLFGNPRNNHVYKIDSDDFRARKPCSVHCNTYTYLFFPSHNALLGVQRVVSQHQEMFDN